jgi:hypothetical protein
MADAEPCEVDDRSLQGGEMKRSSFSADEIAELRRMIREKQTAPADRQKALRGKMRGLGFYITDYADFAGFVESDLDEMIARGTITVAG